MRHVAAIQQMMQEEAFHWNGYGHGNGARSCGKSIVWRGIFICGAARKSFTILRYLMSQKLLAAHKLKVDGKRIQDPYGFASGQGQVSVRLTSNMALLACPLKLDKWLPLPVAVSHIRNFRPVRRFMAIWRFVGWMDFGRPFAAITFATWEKCAAAVGYDKWFRCPSDGQMHACVCVCVCVFAAQCVWRSFKVI